MQNAADHVVLVWGRVSRNEANQRQATGRRHLGTRAFRARQARSASLRTTDFQVVVRRADRRKPDQAEHHDLDEAVVDVAAQQRDQQGNEREDQAAICGRALFVVDLNDRRNRAACP